MNHHRRNSKPGVISVPCWVVDLTLAAVKPISSAKLYRSPIGGNRGEREAARAEMQVDPAALTNFHQRAVFAPPSTSALVANSVPREAGGVTFPAPVLADQGHPITRRTCEAQESTSGQNARPWASRTLAAGDSPADPVPAESRDTLDAGSVSTVAVIEGLEKRGNEGVRLTGAMTLSAPAFAIR